MVDERRLFCYYNLCHPKVSGFKVWMPMTLKAPAEALLQNPSLSADQLQDFCLDVLKLKGMNDKADDQLDPDPDPGFHSVDPLRYSSCLSSNPTALSNHYFPLTVDAQGILQLGLSKSSRNKKKGTLSSKGFMIARGVMNHSLNVTLR